MGVTSPSTVLGTLARYGSLGSRYCTSHVNAHLKAFHLDDVCKYALASLLCFALFSSNF